MKNAIILNQLKIEYNADLSNMKGIIAHSLRVKKEDIYDFEILKKSIDARKKPDIYYIYKVRVIFEENKSHLISKVLKNNNVTEDNLVEYVIPQAGDVSLNKPPVIIGMGPAGLFAGYILAQAGFKPIVLERGRDVASRHEDVTHFWETGELNPESNVQFGEGGAGTFSDGKLNTLVKDKFGRNSYVLHTFYKFGASENILYDAKPHIGTDVLMQVVANMRNEIIRLGGQVLFESKVSGMDFDETHNLKGLYYNDSKYIATDVAILAIGHSARDTFRMLHDLDIDMKAKEFAVGFRVEHPQSMIDISQYGKEYKDLPVANYKLTANLDNSRGVYSFCMCPGGYVVNASSVSHKLAINGMSYSDRASGNANSAIIISVGEKDYDMSDPLAGVLFQEELETKAYELGQGRIPQQLFGDFEENVVSTSYGEFESKVCKNTCFANLRQLLSDEMNESFIEAMHRFGRKIHGFDRADAIMSGIESRTSSPVRITRDESFESNFKGLYPCGEGAGYAGGIMSAAMDGMKVAEKIIEKYKVNYE